MDILGEFTTWYPEKIPPCKCRETLESLGKADGDSLQVFKMQEGRGGLLLATSKSRTKTTERLKRARFCIIKNFLVTSGVLMGGAALISVSFLVLLALRWKVISVVQINYKSLFGYDSMLALETNRKVINNFCGILRVRHIHCLQEVIVLLNLYTISGSQKLPFL